MWGAVFFVSFYFLFFELILSRKRLAGLVILRLRDIDSRTCKGRDVAKESNVGVIVFSRAWRGYTRISVAALTWNGFESSRLTMPSEIIIPNPAIHMKDVSYVSELSVEHSASILSPETD